MHVQHSAARVAATRLAAGQPIFRTAFLLHPSPDSPQIAPWLSEQRDKSILHHGETVAISLLACVLPCHIYGPVALSLVVYVSITPPGEGECQSDL